MDEAGCALVANFSHATLIEDEDSAGNDLEKVGTTAVWAAPEILKGGAFSKQADIFSFAMLMSEVSYGWSTSCIRSFDSRLYCIDTGICWRGSTWSSLSVHHHDTYHAGRATTTAK